MKKRIIILIYFITVFACATNGVPTSTPCELCLQKCGYLFSDDHHSTRGKVDNVKRVKRQSISEEGYPVKAEYHEDPLIWERKPIYYEHDDTEDYTDFHEQNDHLDIICHFKENTKHTEYDSSARKDHEVVLPDKNEVRDRVIWDHRPIQEYDQSMHIIDFKDTDGEHNCPKTIYEEPYPWDEIENTTHMRYHKHLEDNGHYNNTKDSLQVENNVNEIVENQKHQIAGMNKTSENKYLINPANCGFSFKNQLSQGNNATPGQFPWLVRIAYRNITNNRISYRCSGSVVTKDAILTAAHCVKNLVKDLTLAYVLIGDDPNSFKMYEITEIVSHPKYDTPKYAHDIALLRFQNTEDLSTICLPMNNSDIEIGSGVFAGWYADISDDDDKEAKKGFVQFINLAIVNNSACSESYAKFSENEQEPIVIRSEQLCAISEETEDVCQGDSGGPFMQSDSSGSRYTLLGVVAFGLAQPGSANSMCGAFDFPSVYTRVSSYKDWMLSELQNSHNKILKT